jgi:hypothetical protein
MVDDFCVTYTIPESDLDCSGELRWENINPGETVNGEFTVSNIGEPGSMLNWEIEKHPTWGTWTIIPDSGTNLSMGNSTTVLVSVVAPLDKNKKFTGRVRIVNVDNLSDYCYVDSTLKTPLVKNSMNQQAFQFLQHFYRLYNRFFSYYIYKV